MSIMRNMFFFLVFMLFASCTAAVCAELDGRAVAMLVHDRPDGEDRAQVCTMTLINRRGATRVRKVEMRSKDYGRDQKSIMLFREPADVKDTMFLSWSYDDVTHEDDRWLYMPAMKSVRRISGASKNEYFMGTDFTYDDIGKRSVDKDTHALLGEETWEGYDCWKLESIPVDPDDAYARKVSFVDKISYVAVRVEYYDKDGLIKVLTVKDLRRVGEFWTVFLSEMDNVSRSHKTVLQIDSIDYDTGVKDELFRVATLQRGRL